MELISILASFASFSPKFYQYYRQTLEELWKHNPNLKHNFPGSVFPAASINFGPNAISVDHIDHNNLAGGFCAITAGGNFDPKSGGHIYLVDLGLIIEFPPGSTILLPSAVIRHGNIPIKESETRTSFTQFAAGGLFRWVDYGFRTWDQLRRADPARSVQIEENRSQNWKRFLNLYSSLSSLKSDIALNTVRNH